MISNRQRVLARRTELLLSAVLFIPAVLLVQLQQELTNRSGWVSRILREYLNPNPDAIIAPRLLMRWVIGVGTAVWPGFIHELDVNAFIQTCFVWGALVASFAFACRFVNHTFSLMAALIVAVSVPWGFLELGFGLSFPYDLPALFFSAAGLWAIVAKKFNTLVLIMIIGSLNKETIVWLIPAYAALAITGKNTRGDEPRVEARRIMLLGGLFLISYGIPRLAIRGEDHAFAEAAMRISLLENEHDRTSRVVANAQELLFRGRGGAGQNLYWALMVHLPGLIFLRRLPREIRLLYWGVPFLVMPMYVLGNIWETRIYNELLPLSALAVAYLLREITGRSNLDESFSEADAADAGLRGDSPPSNPAPAVARASDDPSE